MAAADALADRAGRLRSRAADRRDRARQRRLDACAASLPLAWNAWPTFAPSTRRPRRPPAPCERTLPARLAGDLRGDLRVALGRGLVDAAAAARLARTEPAVELIVARDLARRRPPAARPWLANVVPACVASLAASVTVLCALRLRGALPRVDLPGRGAPARGDLARAPADRARDPALRPANAPLTAPSCCVPGAADVLRLLGDRLRDRRAVRVAAAFSRCPSACTPRRSPRRRSCGPRGCSAAARAPSARAATSTSALGRRDLRPDLGRPRLRA